MVVNERSYNAATVSTQSIGEKKAGTTHPSGLPLCSQLLQLLVVTELDEDVDRPFIVVLRLVQLDFTRAANTYVCVRISIRACGVPGKDAWMK